VTRITVISLTPSLCTLRPLRYTRDREAENSYESYSSRPRSTWYSTMALVLRSSTDLVYLPDHGLVGEPGGECLNLESDYK
jgi:hypothetical protein